jgi:hypothetical protein
MVQTSPVARQPETHAPPVQRCGESPSQQSLLVLHLPASGVQSQVASVQLAEQHADAEEQPAPIGLQATAGVPGGEPPPPPPLQAARDEAKSAAHVRRARFRKWDTGPPALRAVAQWPWPFSPHAPTVQAFVRSHPGGRRRWWAYSSAAAAAPAGCLSGSGACKDSNTATTHANRRHTPVPQGFPDVPDRSNSPVHARWRPGVLARDLSFALGTRRRWTRDSSRS